MLKVLNGKKLAKTVRKQVKVEVNKIIESGKRPPGLGVILVGENPASQAYVASKDKLAKECGFYTIQLNLSAGATEDEVKLAINSLNNDPLVDGILLQLPLPPHLQASKLINLINPKKDADGLHAVNQGFLARGEHETFQTPLPCTPHGCMMLIDLAFSDTDEGEIPKPVDLSGKRAVVIGRSSLVGKPLGLLLLDRNATLTFVHSKTPNIVEITSQADILIAAVGKPNLINTRWVKKGCIVIDVGINRLDSVRLGDVDFSSVSGVLQAITPVPGGVGPMTVSMLIRNTLNLYTQNSSFNEMTK